MIQDPLGQLVVLLAVVWISISLTSRYAWAERFSAVLWILLLGALASNLGLIPTEAPLYGQLIGLAVPVAVALILFKVDLRDLRTAGRPMIAAFALAAIGTVVGVVVASVVTAPWLEPVLGEDSWKIAGPYVGTYVGGSLNFFALWEGLELGSPDLFAAANAVDNLSILPLYAIWVTVPLWLAGRFPVRSLWALESDVVESDVGGNVNAPAPNEDAGFVLADVVTLMLLAFGVVWASGLIKTHVIDTFAPGVPEILVVTTLALVMGQFRVIKRLQGAWSLGNLAFYLFFAAIGALINVVNAIVLSPILFVFVLIVIVLHMTVTYGGGRLLGMDLGVLTIASIATKAGPPLVLPMAEQKGWQHLALPGMLVGLLGYAIGNYIGFGAAYLVRSLIG